jgi:hypothetical protein
MASGSARLGTLRSPAPDCVCAARGTVGGTVTRGICDALHHRSSSSQRCHVDAPVGCAGGTLHVCASGCPYGSIQTAIDAAESGDRIAIAPGTYTENLHILAPLAAKRLTLIGIGTPQTIVNGKQEDYVLEVDTDYTVTITGMTFTNGKCLPADGILNHGILRLTNVTVRNNEGEETAGGIANDIDGTLTLINSKVNDNTSTGPTSGRGGGIFNLGIVSLTNTTVSGNSAPVLGGGIENRGQLRINDSRITDNTTTGLGGGIENRQVVAMGTAALTLSNSSVSNNTAFPAGRRGLSSPTAAA